MPRPLRPIDDGLIDYVINRGNNRQDVFYKPEDYIAFLRTLAEKELAAVRHCVQRGCPYGSEDWREQTSVKLGLESTLRPRGRPKKHEKGS